MTWNGASEGEVRWLDHGVAQCLAQNSKTRGETEMEGQMMVIPFTIHSLSDHGARYHGETRIISFETDGTKNAL